MTDETTQAGAAAPAIDPTPAVDPLAVFATSPAESQGVLVDVEHPTSGKVLMRFRVSRFGGSNNTAIIREERKLKAKLPQGVRRKIDLGEGDPDVVTRLNRQVFVRVAVMGWEMLDPALAQKWGAFSVEKADELFEAYPRIYELVSEQAVDEGNFYSDRLEETKGN